MAHDITSASNSHLGENLYERDYYTWALEQARALLEQRVEALDWENLADEVGNLARSEARGLKSQLARLLTHLLKWQLLAARRLKLGDPANSWRISIVDARHEVRDLLEELPGLKSRLPELFLKAYTAAVYRTCRETKSDRSRFPASCPWTFEQVMDDDFWPDSEDQPRRKPINRGKKTRKRD